ncbi:hypothetical protein QMZ92_31655 [Streptomyces sp. HNM0645]|uniref:hypothetical protein n=1 Tax=Streptomyces sp. HNM0645 TaxID=2782343 RepID=UPI0024B8322C|nr:hypothetical protein [Streptomyces sp. HNM0645]MDI9888784.1 hypothetical protein [Streptomyces sp. HNM0645]
MCGLPGCTPAPDAVDHCGLGVTRHSPGLDDAAGHGHGHGRGRPAATGIGREGAGVNPLRGQNDVQGSRDTGPFPATGADADADAVTTEYPDRGPTVPSAE